MDTSAKIIPRVWIGCLACCNEGRLVGDWFDAVGADEVTTYDINGAHSRAESHDELWCFDHEWGVSIVLCVGVFIGGVRFGWGRRR